MTNPFNIAGAQQSRPSKKAPLYQGARWTSGLWTNRAAIRDAASTRLEEKFYGPRGDAFLGEENIEISQQLTLVRRPGNSVWNDNSWLNVNGFYEFRLFNSNIEQIKTMVDVTHVLFDATNNSQNAIWYKSNGAGQSYMQSIGNSLYWGDGKSQKKWLVTLQNRIPYTESHTLYLPQNPYNFTPYELDTFIVDPNGNAEQLIATVLQLQNFYIHNNTIVFSLKTDVGGILLPQVWEVLEPGLQIWFEASSQVAQVLGATTGTMLTIQALVGTITSASIYVGGAGYELNDIVNVDQTSLPGGGSTGGQVKVTAIGNASGFLYVTGNSISTTTSGGGAGAILDITVSNGHLVSATIASGGLNYAVDDYVYPVQGNGYGGAFIVNTVSGTGAVTAVSLATGCATAISLQTAGTGYDAAENVATTGGHGVGLTVDIEDDETEFSCIVTYSGGAADAVSVAASGSGYLIGDILIPVQAGQPSAEGLEVTATGINGEVATYTTVSGGPAITAYTTGSTTNTTSGSGSGAAITITSVSGGGDITGVSVSSGGTGYAVGDLLHIIQGMANGAILSVSTLTGSEIATVAISYAGNTPYTTATGVATTTSGSGTGLTINILSVLHGAITGISIDNPGSGYSIEDQFYVYQSGATGAQYTVASLTGATGVASFEIVDGGSSFAVTTPGSSVATTSSGSGTGATIFISEVSPGPPPSSNILGGILEAEIVDGGSGYAINDLLYPSGGGGSPELLITNISSAAGGVTAVTVLSQGTGYVSGTDVPTTGGRGTGAEVNITVDNSQEYPLTVATDVPMVFSGGNPISDSRINSAVVWGNIGETTIDGSALWINRGPVVDGGLVYNWGIQGSTSAPDVVVNNATAGWRANTYYNRWQFIVVKISSSYYVFKLITSGVSGASAPTWNTTPGQNTTDGTAVWQNVANDGDTTLSWADETIYTPGHVLEETAGSTSCIFQLQPFTGVLTQGSSFPIYLWQCNGQSGSDIGAAGELPSGFGNGPMAQNGGQTLSTATYTSTTNSFFFTAAQGTDITNSPIAGDGTVSDTPATIFPAYQNLSLVMQPNFVFPAAGIYTFQIGHQNAMFWGLGKGKIDLNVTGIDESGGILTVTCDKVISTLLSPEVDLTFGTLTNATWLNGVTITVATVGTTSFTAAYAHANYGPISDSGTISSGNTLTPSVLSGPMNWIAPGSLPNVYNFSTGTPVSGYPIMSANYPSDGVNVVVDIVQISVPAAGVYPGEIYWGHWYHSAGSYSTPTTSPTLPSTTFNFYMIYQQPGSGIFYNIIPEGIACTNADAPTWPDWPATVADEQEISPSYPSVTEISGNFTWWNLGPTTTFDWNALVNMTTQTFIIDQNSNQEIPYEAGVSGTTLPTFSQVLYGLTADLANLVWMNNGPIGNTPAGTLTTTQGGWSYVVALVNTLDNTVSNASLPSVSTGNFFGASGVFISGGLPQAPDPQADYVAIFRTDDGGATYYLIPPPNSGNGNTEYTVPLAQYLLQGYTDTTPDSGLNTLLQAPIAFQNSVPPVGSINLAYQDGRIFVSVNNTVYWSAEPDTPVGNGYNGFPPNNYAEFPSSVTKIVPLNVGIFIFTVSDIYVISGNGTSGDPFAADPFLQRVGLLSYNALTVNGSILYFMTTDQQVVELNVHSGVSQIGFPIADQFLLNPWSPATSYLTWHVNGSNDQCLFVADGSTGWFRMSPTAPPEGGSGILTWSPKANIQGGCGAVQSIETAPGNIQLLLAPPPGVAGPILYRNYGSNVDNGSSYLANFVLGSLVLAHPGQLAEVSFITTECEKVPGSLPISLGVLFGEISGEFEDLIYWTNDPPQLFPSQSLYSQRFYLSQTKHSAECRHCQIIGQFEETDSADELFTLTVYGSYMSELG